MKALIDGDILLYRVGFASQEIKERYAVSRLHKTIDKILQDTNCKDFEIFLSDSLENNFRYGIFPLYKANRTQPKPAHFERLSNTVVEDWQSTVCYGMEADDGIGIEATRRGIGESIIVSIDKDLLQIPGRHYNWVNGVWRDIGRPEGLYRFYCQILTGDPTDNITGKVALACPGIGAKKAASLLEHARSTEEYDSTIKSIFTEKLAPKDYDQAEIETRIEVTGQLVKIKQHIDEPLWRLSNGS